MLAADGPKGKSLNPLSASQRIEDDYRRYLLSGYAPRSERFRKAFADALAKQFRLARGPYLQAAPPFEPGASLRDLVKEGVLHRSFERLRPEAFPVDRPLHQHQESAIRKAAAGRNLVVATGTGSGKTECFLIPALHRMFAEGDAGTLAQPGVRALLLYPMNALANDQLRRLRQLLADFPEITFGRYVGETEQNDRKAREQFRERFPGERLLPNELLSRDAMKARPPHFLLTNYAMLEYLLLRAADTPFFDGASGKHWKIVALDEAHVYDGADGAEVAMLLRRVRDRVVESERGRLQCFATSATLGRGREDYPALVEFAEDLFDERFEWDADDERRRDVVGAVRKRMARQDVAYELPRDAYRPLLALVRQDATPDALVALLRNHAAAIPDEVATATSVPALLAALLSKDRRVVHLQRRTEDGGVPLAEAAQVAFGDGAATEDLVALIELAVTARAPGMDESLIPARYHFFLRALEGGYVCLHPAHHPDDPALLLTRHENCPSCLPKGRRSRMFEIGTCRRCGAEYLVGRRLGERFVQAPPYAPLTYLLLDADASGGDEDEDEEDDVAAPAPEPPRDRRELCVVCGMLVEQAGDDCDCTAGEKSPRVRVALIPPSKGADVLHRCGVCSGRATGDVVSRLLTGADAPPAVIATSLYQEIPPSAVVERATSVGEGRQLLVFSDSRQDAAFFAPYFERTYLRAVERALLLQAAMRADPDALLRSNDLAIRVVRTAQDAYVLDPDEGVESNRRAVHTWVLREILAADRRQSLDGSGLLDIAVAFPSAYAPPPKLLSMGFTAQEATDLLALLLDTVRWSGAVTAPDGVDIRDPEFAPRNRETGFRHRGKDPGVQTWVPSKGSNRRVELLQKIFARKGITADPVALLDELWDYFTHENGPWAKVFVSVNDKAKGILRRIAYERLEFRPLSASRRPYRCDRCRQLWWRSVAGACPTYRCSGTLRQTADGDLDTEHYTHLYRSLNAIGLSVQEHTAQWTPAQGSLIQTQFQQGRVNALSCSTTFELGVDLGEIEAVLLRNVPPSPANYVQRAGRAGRRANAAALVVTFAQRRSHDLAYFDRPEQMVNGVIAPPRILIDNPTIVRRHVHSVAFAAFEREVASHGTVGAFFDLLDGAAQTACADFVAWLRTHPAKLGAALTRLVPAETARNIGLDSWSWVEALVKPDDDDPTRGWLDRAQAEVTDDLAALRQAKEAATREDNLPFALALGRQLNTLLNQQLLEHLARRNVLPKYGFPVDVVQLDLTRSSDHDADNLELDRDLALAIRDYAPGAQVVAAKKLWTSLGLRTRPQSGWPEKQWGICKQCGAYREHPTALPPSCAVCQSVDTERTGTLVRPVFGFVGENQNEGTGESRPVPKWYAESYFSEYQADDPSKDERVDELSRHGTVVSRRVSRQGRITVLNRGPNDRGFRLCHTCGYGEPAPPPGNKKTTKKLDHPNVRKAASGRCSGTLVTQQLGHEFLTDVVEIRLSEPLPPGVARSLLYAVLEGAALLPIKRDEIDGTLRTYRIDGPRAYESLVIFDTVPGGAGHAQRIGRNLPTVFAFAQQRVASCEGCGDETSCYACLRNYTNQKWHEALSRGQASAALVRVLSGRSES